MGNLQPGRYDMGRRGAFRTLKVKQFSLVLFVDARHPGWFYVKSPPSPERSMLMGTFGTNDASTLYSGSSRPGGVRRAISRWSPEMAKRCPQIVMSHPLLCEFFFSHSISPSPATTSLEFCNLQLAGIQPHGDVQL